MVKNTKRHFFSEDNRSFEAIQDDAQMWVVKEVISPNRSNGAYRRGYEKELFRVSNLGEVLTNLANMGVKLVSKPHAAVPSPKPLDLSIENVSALWSLVMKEARNEPHEGRSFPAGSQLRAAEKIGPTLTPPVSGKELMDFLTTDRNKKVAATNQAKREAGIPDIRTRRYKKTPSPLITTTVVERVNLEENPDVVEAFAQHRMVEDLKAVLSTAKIGGIYRINLPDRPTVMKLLRNIAGTFTVLEVKGVIYAERIR